MGHEKWILYNNVEQKTSWGKQSEPHQQPHQRLVFIQEGHGVDIVGLEGSPLLRAASGKPNY